MTEQYAVQGSVSAYLTHFHRFDAKLQKKIFDTLLDAALDEPPPKLKDALFVPVSNQDEGLTVIALLQSADPEPVADPASAADPEPDEALDEAGRFVMLKVSSDSNPNMAYSVRFDTVTQESVSCTCKDFLINQNPRCKHMRRTDFAYRP